MKVLEARKSLEADSVIIVTHPDGYERRYYLEDDGTLTPGDVVFAAGQPGDPSVILFVPETERRYVRLLAVRPAHVTACASPA